MGPFIDIIQINIMLISQTDVKAKLGKGMKEEVRETEGVLN